MTLQSCWTFCENPQAIVDAVREVAPNAEVTSGKSNRGNDWVNVESEGELPLSVYRAAEGNGFLQKWCDEGLGL
jgi:uncharacterized GH25 family protein